ncbi:hypothetical protein JW979_09095, partial [bacterium]|nr:hypothetical protein [candidate division CSSED10-310 bacterium]
KGDLKKAHAFFDLLDNSQENELALLGKAWLAYEDNRPVEALRNAENLLKQNMVSSYMYEARVLAASSKQLLGKREEALSDLKNIFESGNLIREVEHNSDFDVQSNPDGNKQSLIEEVEKLSQFMGTQEYFLDSDSTSTNATIQKEIVRLDKLESKAIEKNDLSSLSEIRQLRGQMIESIQSPVSSSRVSALDKKDPLIEQLGMSEYLSYLFRTLLLETLSEKQKAKQDIKNAGELREQARSKDQFSIAIQMEIRIEELQDYYNYLNRNEIWLKENVPQELQIEVGQWANFSGYGISNINFSRIKEIEQRKAKVSRLLASAERCLTKKREQLELRIQNLLGDVERIEDQIREESIKREDREREQLFHQEYFDKRVRESNL